jgi:hypothetical protein
MYFCNFGLYVRFGKKDVDHEQKSLVGNTFGV